MLFQIDVNIVFCKYKTFVQMSFRTSFSTILNLINSGISFLAAFSKAASFPITADATRRMTVKIGLSSLYRLPVTKCSNIAAPQCVDDEFYIPKLFDTGQTVLLKFLKLLRLMKHGASRSSMETSNTWAILYIVSALHFSSCALPL